MNLYLTSEDLTNENSGDIANFIENKNNKIWYVIDAVSSSDNPRIAAYYTHEIIKVFLEENTIKNRYDIGALIKEIHEQLKAQDLKLSVCFAAVIELPDGTLEVINVGDCRLYEIGDNSIIRITKDDSVVQELLDKGEITEEQAFVNPQKSFVTQTLGGSEVLKMNFYSLSEDAKGFMLTSDGVHGELMDHQMEGVLFRENLTTEESFQTILNRSKSLEGHQDDQSLILFIKNKY